jgi:hypothetical protein
MSQPLARRPARRSGAGTIIRNPTEFPGILHGGALMMKSCRLSLLAICMLAFPFAALADDADLAAKLVGTWEGRWVFGDAGGKLTARITAAKGNSLDGETTWFGTVAGDFNDSFTGAKLKDRKLKVSEGTMDFVVTVSEDGTSMEGKWTSPVATGPMSLKKKVE